jgi:RimJ/RimL family protein N-acetyltransferase
MRINEALAVQGERCRLVPYRAHHVPAYHAWMQDPAMLEATASEPLTLEEEFRMCDSWREDADKCTFIVEVDGEPVGDVNLFLNDSDDSCAAEIEVMIAVGSARRRGVAAEALALLQAWAAGALGLRTFRAKVGHANAPSLALFRGRLGYALVSSSTVFEEVCARCNANGGHVSRAARAGHARAARAC